MKIDNKILTLVNIYAPNNDNATFSQNLLDQILSFECEEIIMGGDFNLVMDVQKDKKGGNGQRRKIRLKKSEHSELAGPDWCVASPKSRRYAFHLAEN